MRFESAKMMPARSKGAGTPSADQLAQIRPFCLNDMTADQLYTRSFVLAHNCIDRDQEVFDEGLLADFAKTLPGKGIFVKHPMSWDGDSGPAEGKWYGASLQTISLDEAKQLLREPSLTLPPDRSMVTLLCADGYFAKTEDNADLLTKMDAGIAGDVSIGFSATSRVPIKDAQGRELQACRIMGPGEGLEGSLVWLGAQPGARAVKNAKKSTIPQSEVSEMDEKDFKAKLDEADAKLKAMQPDADFRTALKAALGKDHESLADDAKALAAHVLAGKSANSAMVDELIARDRQAGALGDGPEEVAAAKSAYAALPFAQLKTLHTIACKRDATDTPTKGAIRGGDPNANGGEKSAALPTGSLFSNPLIG